MTPAEFRSYAELAGWLVIGLYLFARLVRGDREISVRIGGSKRKVKLRELASRLESCERGIADVPKHHANLTVQGALKETIEQVEKKQEDDHQHFTRRCNNLNILIAKAQRRAEDAAAPAKYAENMIDRIMPVIAWLAWHAGKTLQVEYCSAGRTGDAHRKRAMLLGDEFAAEIVDPKGTLRLVDNHSPFPITDEDDDERQLFPPPKEHDAANLCKLATELEQHGNTLTEVRRALCLLARDGKTGGGLTLEGLNSLIDMLVAALFADEIPTGQPREFSRQSRNAIRLARTAGESDAPHIEEGDESDAQPAPHPDPITQTSRVSMCDHCGNVETKAGELCPACVAYEVEEEKKAAAARAMRDAVAAGKEVLVDAGALKQATKPPAAVMTFWDHARPEVALMSLFDEQSEETSYTFGSAALHIEHPEIGEPVISDTGAYVGKVADWNDDCEGNCWATIEAATGGMYVLPMLRVIKPSDRDDYR